MSGFAAQRDQELFRQPGFAGAAAPDDGNEDREGRRSKVESLINTLL